MKLLKRITAVMAALLIILNFVVLNIFAVAGAVAVTGAVVFLSALLLAAGHSQADINSMSAAQMQSVVVDDFNTGKITADTLIIDPFTGDNVTALDYLTNGEYYDISNAFNNFVSDWKDGYNRIFKPTCTTDFPDGCGAYYIVDYGNKREKIPCDYIVISSDNKTFCLYANDNNRYLHSYTDYGNGWVENNYLFAIYVSGTSRSFSTTTSNGKYELSFYGDVRYEDGTQAPTSDEWEYQIGEADGTKVTVDMLNPDGTVTIDGVTYYPADYLDPDNLTEEGKKQLIYNITNVINNTYVISEDEPIVDVDDITVEVSEELENFTVPTGIITVFPFCLPFDFVRGMKLFSAKPVTPHFEITIDVPEILNVPAQKWTLEIDLEKFEPLAKITRWLSLFGFSYLLISLSTKIVKGAGA